MQNEGYWLQNDVLSFCSLYRRWDSLPLNKDQLLIGLERRLYKAFPTSYHVWLIPFDSIDDYECWKVGDYDFKEGVSSGRSNANGTVSLFYGCEE